MAKKKRESVAGLENDSSKTRLRFAKIPSLGILYKGFGKEIAKWTSAKTVGKTLQALATRKQTVENVLLNMAQGATAMIETAMKTEKNMADREAHLNKNYRESLIERKREVKSRRAHRTKKDEYVVTGELLHPKTGKPVPGMVVEAIDKDITKHDLLGVDTTDSKGRFEIVFKEKDFKERGEGLPEILIRAGLNRDKIVQVTKDVLKLEPGTSESLKITLPENMEYVAEKIKARRKHVDRKRLNRASQSLVFNRIGHMAAQEMGKVFKDGLNQAIHVLEARVKTEGKKKTRKAREKTRKKTDA
jgi:hypothetical protein